MASDLYYYSAIHVRSALDTTIYCKSLYFQIRKMIEIQAWSRDQVALLERKFINGRIGVDTPGVGGGGGNASRIGCMRGAHECHCSQDGVARVHAEQIWSERSAELSIDERTGCVSAKAHLYLVCDTEY